MIPMFKVFMADTAAAEAARVLQSGQIGQGSEVDAFEDDLERFMGVRPVTVNSCTSALHLALHLCGVDSDSEVITTPQTCLATNVSICHLGATPVFADIDPLTGNIDPDSVRSKITPFTKAIIAVDWAGRACEYGSLKSHGIPVVQDAAHAVATIYNGTHVAQTGGDYVCFSFQAIKHLTCGDGGALVVPKEQVDRARRLRWYGIDRDIPGPRFEQPVSEAGFKFHMNDIAAVIGRSNLPHLEEIVWLHREHARRLSALLKGVPDVRFPGHDPSSSCWLYTIHVPEPKKFIADMRGHGVECSRVHSRNDTHACFGGQLLGLPGVDAFDAHQVSIPVGWWLHEGDIDRIVEAVESCA